MVRLLLLFIVLPAVELGLLMEIGGRIGIPATIGLIVLTGVVGAALARRQGLRVIGEIQKELGEGRLPASSLTDGLMILIASALLVTPGVLTDAFGFLCLMPGFRTLVKGYVRTRFEAAAREGRVHVSGIDLGPPGGGPIIDITPEDARPKGSERGK